MSVSDWLSMGTKDNYQSNGWFSGYYGGQREKEEQSIIPSLSWYQRIAAFVILLALGCASLFLSSLLILKLRAFTKFFTLGNLLIMSSTFFVVGPAAQCRSLCQPARFFAFVLYMGAMFGTLYVALHMQRTGLALVFVVIQMLAAVWYGASYIPYAQSCLLSTTRSVLPV
uniref:Vesicle transport protein n=1 Tax=Paramoeba aestuarina TaxID=180227 RepID=A0A7S4N484_9EUKA|mmetsp:Transcript_10650/g.16037  ORF Transcript_10650/g.16037 Transcript_10650/m.16037 type:complete len:170 (+) Transcript_10650:50-559(+)